MNHGGRKTDRQSLFSFLHPSMPIAMDGTTQQHKFKSQVTSPTEANATQTVWHGPVNVSTGPCHTGAVVEWWGK